MQVKRNIMINKAGGHSGANTKNYRVSIPADMIREIGVTEEDRSVILDRKNGILTIKNSPEQ